MFCDFSQQDMLFFQLQKTSSYYKSHFIIILAEYQKIIDIPAMYNTSFNLAGEQIVESPIGAIMEYLEMKADYFVAGNYLIYTLQNNSFLLKHTERKNSCTVITPRKRLESSLDLSISRGNLE